MFALFEILVDFSIYLWKIIQIAYLVFKLGVDKERYVRNQFNRFADNWWQIA